jgi:DNA repair exonuclease SbcCD ATPase subunit
MATATFGQAASSDSQTLHALLSEVRALRQDLQSSLARVQSAQILLSRLQIQEAVVTRASENLDDARSKLADVQVVQKSERAELRHYEELSSEADPRQRQNLQDNINSAQSDLEASTLVEQQRQAAETEAQQQLQTEQSKLNTLGNQLDELVKNMDDHAEQSRVPR